jgi:hypothetical protein
MPDDSTACDSIRAKRNYIKMDVMISFTDEIAEFGSIEKWRPVVHPSILFTLRRMGCELVA